MKHRISEFFRNVLMSFAITCLCKVEKISLDSATHDYFPEDENGASFVDHLRWKLESPFMRLFSLAHEGSDAELRSFWDCEIGTDDMNDRQLADLDQYDPQGIDVVCFSCFWHGTLAETTGALHICPGCDDSGVNYDAYGDWSGPIGNRTPPQAQPLYLLTERRAA